MSKKINIGIDDVARNITKLYLGIDDIARRVRKAYIGIGGLARPFWSEEVLLYLGKIHSTAIAESRYNISSGIYKSGAVFAGGRRPVSGSTTYSNAADIYNSSATRHTVALSESKQNIGIASTGSYILFAGGNMRNMLNSWSTRVEVYNHSSGTKMSDCESLSNRYPEYGSGYVAATTVGDYALFGGGNYFKSGSTTSGYQQGNTTAYNSSLTKFTPDSLASNVYDAAATTVGNYALIGGGTRDTNSDTLPSNTMNAYNSSLTKVNVTHLLSYRLGLAATTVGDYALFGGGFNGSIYSESSVALNTIEAYNKSLTRVSVANLSRASSKRTGAFVATRVGRYAVFAGTGLFDIYNSSLTKIDHSILLDLTFSSDDLAAASNSDYSAVFVGGRNTNANIYMDNLDY